MNQTPKCDRQEWRKQTNNVDALFHCDVFWEGESLKETDCAAHPQNRRSTSLDLNTGHTRKVVKFGHVEVVEIEHRKQQRLSFQECLDNMRPQPLHSRVAHDEVAAENVMSSCSCTASAIDLALTDTTVHVTNKVAKMRKEQVPPELQVLMIPSKFPPPPTFPPPPILPPPPPPSSPPQLPRRDRRRSKSYLVKTIKRTIATSRQVRCNEKRTQNETIAFPVAPHEMMDTISTLSTTTVRKSAAAKEDKNGSNDPKANEESLTSVTLSDSCSWSSL